MRLAAHVVARAPRRPDRRMRNVDHSAMAEGSLRRACPSRKLLADMTAASAEAIMLKQTGCMRGCRPDPPCPCCRPTVLRPSALRGASFLVQTTAGSDAAGLTSPRAHQVSRLLLIYAAEACNVLSRGVKRRLNAFIAWLRRAGGHSLLSSGPYLCCSAKNKKGQEASWVVQ